MLYTTIKINNEEYKCRLNASACIEAEKKLGTNPINILMKSADGEVPSLESLITIFYAALQPYNHNVTFQKACELYDDYCAEEDHNLMTFTEFIVEIFGTAGFDVGKTEGSETKNSKK